MNGLWLGRYPFLVVSDGLCYVFNEWKGCLIQSCLRSAHCSLDALNALCLIPIEPRSSIPYPAILLTYSTCTCAWCV